MTELEMLEKLKDFDTPSITNVVATYPGSPLCLELYDPWYDNWYTDQSIRCMYPELGRTVGYAVTSVHGLPDPDNKTTMGDVFDALDASKKPSILVFEQRFPCLKNDRSYILNRLACVHHKSQVLKNGSIV